MLHDTITLTGTIQKLIDRTASRQPPLAQLHFQGADHLYDELRIPNTFGWEQGKTVEVTFRLLPADAPLSQVV